MSVTQLNTTSRLGPSNTSSRKKEKKKEYPSGNFFQFKVGVSRINKPTRNNIRRYAEHKAFRLVRSVEKEFFFCMNGKNSLEKRQEFFMLKIKRKSSRIYSSLACQIGHKNNKKKERWLQTEHLYAILSMTPFIAHENSEKRSLNVVFLLVSLQRYSRTKEEVWSRIKIQQL